MFVGLGLKSGNCYQLDGLDNYGMLTIPCSTKPFFPVREVSVGTKKPVQILGYSFKTSFSLQISMQLMFNNSFHCGQADSMTKDET